MSQQKLKAQENAKSFLNQHGIEKLISEMLNSLVHSKDPNPLIFMVKNSQLYLALDQVLSKPGHRYGTVISRNLSNGTPTSESAHRGVPNFYP